MSAPSRYAKPPLTFDQQAQLLLARGLIAPSAAAIREKLQAVSYYRLSAYWHPFKQPDETLKPGTTLDMVWRRYVFDRQLRLLVMDAIERVEIAVRTGMVEQFTNQYGAFGYRDVARLPGLHAGERADFLEEIQANTERSREEFVRHYKAKYPLNVDTDGVAILPLWMAAEVMSFGTLFTLYRGLEFCMKKEVARGFGVMAPVFESWLNTLNYVRNLCAHHARLWNRELAIKPRFPERKFAPGWHVPTPISNLRIFAVLTLLQFLLKRVAPQSRWPARLRALLAEYPDVPLRYMGFPEHWEKTVFWSDGTAESKG